MAPNPAATSSTPPTPAGTPHTLPATIGCLTLAADLTAPDLDGRFDFALDRLLDGIAALSDPRGPRS